MNSRYRFIILILALGVLVLIGAGCKKETNLLDCPFQCCVDGQYKLKECPTGYLCKDNECIAKLLPGEEEEEEEEEEWMPNSDKVSGVEPATRYPGSVMYKYLSPVWQDVPVSFSAAIEYRTTDDFNTVLDWYRAQRTWQETSIIGEEIDLYSVTATEYLEVHISSDAALQRTSISILYYTE